MTVILLPLLFFQAVWLKIKVLVLPEPNGKRSGSLGDKGNKLNLLVIGDSAAAGVGVNEQSDALAWQLAQNLGRKYQVNWQLVAKTGFTSKDIIKELNGLPNKAFDYVLVSVGVNDVTHLTSIKQWYGNINATANLIDRKFDSPTLLLTCVPPMQLFKAIPFPLNWWFGTRAKRFNSIMTKVADSKPYCTLLRFDTPFEPKFLAQDGIHPSSIAYRLWATQATNQIDSSTD